MSLPNTTIVASNDNYNGSTANDKQVSNNNNNNDLVYLPKSFWSPRYESYFYTVQIEGKRLVSSFGITPYDSDDSDKHLTIPKSNSINIIPVPQPNTDIHGKTNLPAYYYKLVVYRQHTKTIIYRRYSQFQWLHEQLIKYPPVLSKSPIRQQDITTSNNTEQQNNPLPKLPSKNNNAPGCFIGLHQNDEFAQTRLELLADYISDILSRPGYANHPAVLLFLELSSQ